MAARASASEKYGWTSGTGRQRVRRRMGAAALICRVRHGIGGERCVVGRRTSTQNLTEDGVELAQMRELRCRRFVAVGMNAVRRICAMLEIQVRCDVRQRALLCEQHERANDVDQSACNAGR